MENFEELEQLPKKKTDIGEIIDEGFEIYKKIAIPAGLGFFMIISVAIFIVSTIMAKYVDVEKLKEMKGFNPETLTWQQNLMIVGGVALFSALISPFVAGILKMAQDADNGEEVKFSTFWYYVNSSRFIHLVLITITISVISFATESVFQKLLPENLAGMMSIVISILFNTFTFLAIPYILFKEMNFIQGLQESLKMVSKNFVLVFIALLLGQLFAILGLLAFCVGIIFSMPILSAFQYVTYKKLS